MTMRRASKWEVEVKVRRNGRLYTRSSGLGDDPVYTFHTATNDVLRELEQLSAGENDRG